MATEHDRRALAAIVVEARRLAEEQRRALRHADFPELLATAGAFHRLVARLDTLSPESLTLGSDAELRDLHDQIVRQNHLLQMTLAATTPARRSYSRGQPTGPGSSLLIDQYT